MHEVLQAYFRESTGKPEVFIDEDHNKRAENYIKPIAEYLSSLYWISMDDSYALVYGSASDTNAYNNSVEFEIVKNNGGVPVKKSKDELSAIYTLFLINRKGRTLCN